MQRLTSFSISSSDASSPYYLKIWLVLKKFYGSMVPERRILCYTIGMGT